MFTGMSICLKRQKAETFGVRIRFKLFRVDGFMPCSFEEEVCKEANPYIPLINTIRALVEPAWRFRVWW